MDVVSVFLYGTTYQSLVHKLGCVKPRTTRDLLDIATNHASDEEVSERSLATAGIGAGPSAMTKAKAPPHKEARRTRRIGGDWPTQPWSP